MNHHNSIWEVGNERLPEFKSHTRWDCRCHVVFIPKRRKKEGVWSCAEASWVKEYIRAREKEDERVDQLSLGFEDRSPSGDS